MGAKVELHDVLITQHSVVPCIGCVVRRHMVKRAARRERDSGLKTIFFHELPVHVFNLLAQVDQADARLDDPLRKFPNLREGE